MPRMERKNLFHITEENIITYGGRWRLNNSVNATCQTVYWRPGIQSHPSINNDKKTMSIFNNVASVLHGRYHTRKNSVKLISQSRLKFVGYEQKIEEEIKILISLLMGMEVRK